MIQSAPSRSSSRRSGASGGVTQIVAGTNITISSTGTTSGTGVVTINSTGVASSVPLSGITAATAANTINNLNFGQVWTWNTLTGSAVGLSLTSTATPSAGNSPIILQAVQSGVGAAGEESRAIVARNTKTGGTSINVAFYGDATTGSTNYAFLAANGLIQASADGVRYYNASGGHTTIKSPNIVGQFTITLPGATPGGNGYLLSTTTAGVTSWVSGASLGIPLSSTTALVADWTIANGTNATVWTSTLASTALAQQVGVTQYNAPGGAGYLNNYCQALFTTSGNNSGAFQIETISVHSYATGADPNSANIGIKLDALGATINYAVKVDAGEIYTGPAGVSFANTGRVVQLRAQTGLGGYVTFYLPQVDGSANHGMITNGSGVLSFTALVPFASPTFTGTVTTPALALTSTSAGSLTFAVAAPNVVFMNWGTANTGFSSPVGSGQGLRLTDLGTEIWFCQSGYFAFSVPVWNSNGTVTAPSVSNVNDADTGRYFVVGGVGNLMADTCGGKQVITYQTQATNLIRRVTVVGGTDASIASAATVAWEAFTVAASTLTLTGSTALNGVTSFVKIAAPTVTDASALTIDTFASLYVVAPVAAGSVTITDSWGIYTTGRTSTTACVTAAGSVSAVGLATGGANNGLYSVGGNSLAVSVYGTQAAIYDVPGSDGDTGLQLIRQVGGVDAVGRVKWVTLASITTEMVLIIA